MTERNSIGRALAPGFHPAPSSSQGSTSTYIATQPPLPCKSKTRRKRHVPPGPAGVWYQAKQHIAAGNSRSKTTTSTTIDDDEDNDDDDALYDSTDKHRSRRRRYHGTHEPLPAPDVTIHPAWMLMQLQLPGLLTPYLPPYATTAQRYASLRPVVPNEYMLLPELLPDDTPLTALSSRKTFDDEQDSPKLMVLVHAVHSHASCDWTAELHDETGTAIVAWIAPSLVMKERDTPDKVRAGVVVLQGLSILPTMTKTSNRGSASSNGTNLIESKCLLVQEASIIQYWVAPKEVSPQVYLDWMQKRNALPTSFESSSVPSTGNEDDDERMEVEVDLPSSTVPRLIGVSQHRQEMRHGEDHDNDVITADFGLQILPTLHPPSVQPHPPSMSDSCDIYGSNSAGASQTLARMNPYGCRSSRSSGSSRLSSPCMPPNLDRDDGNSQRNHIHNSSGNPDSSPVVSSPKRPERTNPYTSFAAVEMVPSSPIKRRSPLALKQSNRKPASDQSALQLPGIAPSDANPPQQTQLNRLEAFAAPQGKKEREVQKENQMPAKPNTKLRKTGSPKRNQPFSNFLSVASSSMMAMFEDDDDDDVVPTRLELKNASDETELLSKGTIPEKLSLFQDSRCMDGLMKMFDEDDEDE
ncbi:hypothetical protein MHU86_4214 [Fragilaria crotonensis]|nr:hypothetical protein MHU86_4214 [Fragilaria crotonensis]